MARQEIAREPPSKRRPAQAIWHLALGILAGLAALVALTALALALSFTLLTQTRPGRALVLDRVHGALDASLSGQITIGDFRIAPGLSLGLRLEGVRIAGADGAPIARADRVELDLWLPSLLGARIDVERLGVAGLEAELAERAGELNLAKALSARTPSAEEPADRPWLRDLIRRGTLALKGAAIQGRAISFSRSGAPADQRLQLDDFCLTASGLLSRARFEAALELEGTLTSPIARDLAIDAQGSGVPFEQIDLRHLSVRLGGSSLRLRGRQRGASAEAILESLILDRADLAHLAPRFRPGAERLEAAGAARVDQGLATAMLDIALGQGALALHAQSQLKARAFRAVLDVEALDPAQVMVGLPSGAIRARLQGDWQPCSGTRLGLGSIALQLAPSSLGQGQIEALTAVIGLAGDRAEIAELHLSIPGSKLSGSGALFLGEAGDRRAASVEAALALDVDSLASSAKEIAGMAGLSLPEMCGSGQIRARVQGGLGQGARPLAAEIEALFDHLSLSAIQLQGATLAAELPDLKNPLALAGELRARRGHLWHRPIRALSAALRSDGHAFSARLSMQQGDRLALRLGGALAPDRKALRLDRLELSVPRHTWQLGRPAAFDLRDGAAVDRLEMRSGRQVLVLEGGLLRDRLRARLSGTAIDLSAWPRTGLPALRGELDFAAEVAGTVRRPTARLRLLARALAIGPLDALELRLDGELADRMQLGLALSRGRQALRLQAELPRLWEGGQARRPMRARLDLEGVDLGSLGALVPRGAAGPGPATAQPALLPEAGTLSGCAEIAGSPGAPEARLSLRATGVALGPRIPMFDLDLSATLGQALAASAAFSLDRGALDLDARLGLPLARAIGDLRRDRAKRFLDRPLSLRARWQGLDLERMAGPWLPIGARGLLSGELAISGTARAPRGTLALDVRQGVFRALKAIDLSLRLDLRAPRLDLTADVSIAEQGLMRLSGTLGCSAASLIAASDLRRHLGRAPLDVSAELGPIGLEYLLGPSALSMGSLEASAALNGNLELPRLALKGMLRDFWLGPEGIGVLRFEGGYAEGRLSLDSKLLRLDKIAVNSVAPLIVEEVDRVASGARAPRTERRQRPVPRPPVLEFGGTVEAQLGLEALAAGRADPKSWPGALTLKSRAFQLAWLSGFLRGRRELAGRIDASIRARGRLGAPTAQGFLRLEGGALALPSVGHLRQLSARLDFEGRTIRIEQVDARAGQGKVSLHGLAEWPTRGFPLSLSAELSLDKLPLAIDGQRLGALTSAPVHIAGTIGPREIALSLQLDKLRFDLAELRLGRELQALAPHRDIEIHRSRQRRADPRPAPSPRALDLSLRARAIEVVSRDLKLSATADLSLHRRDGVLAMRGEILANAGKAEVLGRSFELESARLTWEGTPPNRAGIDATVLHENAREGVDVKITVAGMLPKPRLELTSEPPHGEQALAMLIATGRLNQRRGAGGMAAGDGAASIVGAFFADRLRRTIASQLPLDVLQFDLGEDGLTSARIEAGTYLTDELYLGYQRDFGADPARENVDEVRIEFQLTPTLSIESHYGYGDESRGGIGILYNKDY